MTTDPGELAGTDQVHDGIKTPGRPLPRDLATPDVSGQVPPEGGSDDDNSDAVDAGQSTSASPPGPAEEKDEQTTDDRGLTTETNPTD
jgi:hypothetical protein